MRVSAWKFTAHYTQEDAPFEAVGAVNCVQSSKGKMVGFVTFDKGDPSDATRALGDLDAIRKEIAETHTITKWEPRLTSIEVSDDAPADAD